MADPLNHSGVCWREDLKAIGRHPSPSAAILSFWGNAGFRTVCLYRASAALYRKGGVFRKLARFVSVVNLSLSSCDIDPRARIGAGVRMIHPVGIVIGEGVSIGSGCWIFQNSTFGSAIVKGVQGPMDNPILGDDVLVGAGAVIVGSVHVGNGAKIGANAVVNRDVPANTSAVGVPARIVVPLSEQAPIRGGF